MSTYGINVPSPDEINYHEAQQVQRVQAALKRLDPSDILSIIDDRISAEADPTKHPLYGLVLFCLDRQVAVHGGEFWDTWKALACQAIDRLVEARLQGED